jgi:hypothetical protein
MAQRSHRSTPIGLALVQADLARLASPCHRAASPARVRGGAHTLSRQLGHPAGNAQVLDLVGDDVAVGVLKHAAAITPSGPGRSGLAGRH